MSLETAKKPLEIKTDCVSTFQAVQIESNDPALIEKKIAETVSADARIVIWQMDKILFGRWQAGHITLPEEGTVRPDLWQEIRIFNENEELHLRRAGKGFRGRHRKDAPTAQGGSPYVDSFSRFWGTSVSGPNGGYAALVDESRKLRLVIPIDGEAAASWYGLETRNYIGSDEETGLSGYIDYRFVHIASAEEGQ